MKHNFTVATESGNPQRPDRRFLYNLSLRDVMGILSLARHFTGVIVHVYNPQTGQAVEFHTF